LPDVLPASAKNIYINSKWWSRGALGVFSFDRPEQQAFFSKLVTDFDPRTWGDWQKSATYFAKEGVISRGYASAEGRWLFSCLEQADSTICTWAKL
jgi:hypothetical protein